jgi:23S rRNA (pseudouridine1915-N3)-methyltransferase
MKCRLIAAGTRLPDWVNAGFREYQQRLRAPLVLELVEIPTAKRRAGENPERAVAREGESMLAVWLAGRLRDAKPLALLIGGPDGLAPLCRERADQSWSLSPLTLPHALVRVVVAEQIYRAMSLNAGHPYHRA